MGYVWYEEKYFHENFFGKYVRRVEWNEILLNMLEDVEDLGSDGGMMKYVKE